MTTITIPMTTTICEGQTFYTPCFSKKLRVGETVHIARAVGPFIGRPIARGVCIQRGQDDPKSPVTPTKTGKRRKNAWRSYYQIQVQEIF